MCKGKVLPVVQTTNVSIIAANALPVLQVNGPWSVVQANVPWLTQEVGNVTVQGSAIAIPSSMPYSVIAAQVLPVIQTTNVSIIAANALPVSQASGLQRADFHHERPKRIDDSTRVCRRVSIIISATLESRLSSNQLSVGPLYSPISEACR